MNTYQYTVLMSLYQKEKPDFLRQSIDSILNQTVQPNEIVVVLDGPITKDLQSVLDDFSSQLTIVPLEENVGLGLALNEGIKHCKDELIARMDTDDIMKPTRCEKQLNKFQQDPHLSIVGTQIDEFIHQPGDANTSRVVPLEHEEILRFSRRRNPFNHPSVMYRKSTVLKYDGYKDIRRNQDFDLFVRMLIGGEKAYNIDEGLLYFRANEDNLSRRKSWQKVYSDIKISNRFRKIGHSNLIDFLIVSTSHMVLYLSPNWLAEWISKKILRKKSD